VRLSAQYTATGLALALSQGLRRAYGDFFWECQHGITGDARKKFSKVLYTVLYIVDVLGGSLVRVFVRGTSSVCWEFAGSNPPITLADKSKGVYVCVCVCVRVCVHVCAHTHKHA
jgi:hypothetical protein